MTPGEPPPLSVPIRVGGDVAPPRKLTDVKPGYPSEAVVQGLQGTVILAGTVASDGSVQDLRTLRGPSVLAAAAAEAVLQWRYTPTTLNRVPVQVPVTITVNFSLR
jgi:protein TonB